MKVVLLRFDAPLMSFGGVVVDQHNRTDAFPYRAMLTGLIANALGMSRRDEDAVHALQCRIRYAARRDRSGTEMVDYQTVDLGAEGPMADGLGWTTLGRLERRGGGDASDGTHIRYRHYLADAIITVALTLDPEHDDPTLSVVSEALKSPARPLFIGRKCCIPSGRMWLGEVEAPSLRQALEATPIDATRADRGPWRAVWPEHEGTEGPTRLWPRVEDRDKRNAIHVGRRVYCEGLVHAPSAPAITKEEA